ncbi:hypothetical protein CcI49_18830 [Frankia sp. CcI49]|uniref:hypothetical protein n=1 Tax=Frankia sp. CcI49 TaxID=1745382 RepID=UPI00097653F8|nr:hypothetical protein [Frankia sp. CcI49]ONH58809.1 hypothetical protein CcI49_18830 [Frankia sp. CcI49]
MPSIQPPDHGPWRNPFDGQRFVSVRRTDRGLYELTLTPGADLHDLIDVTATLPRVVYLDHRPAEPTDPTVILTFGPIPTPARRPAHPSTDGPIGWTPTVDTTTDPPTLAEADFRTILDARIYRLYGRHLNDITHPTP